MKKKFFKKTKKKKSKKKKTLLFDSKNLDSKSRVFDKLSFSVEELGFSKPYLPNLINLVFRFEKPGVSIQRANLLGTLFFE